MLPITTAQQRFTYVGPIPQPWLPTVLRLTVATLPHGSVARGSSGGYVVPDASHPGVTPNARSGRVPVAEHRIFIFPDQYTCDFVSHVRGRRRRGRMAGVAKGSMWTARSARSRSRGGHMQAHPKRRQAICGSGAEPASSLRDVGAAPRTQGEPGLKAVAERSHFRTWMSENVSRARRHSDFPGSISEFRSIRMVEPAF